MLHASFLLYPLLAFPSGEAAPADTVPPIPWAGYAPSRLIVHMAGGQGLVAAGLGWTTKTDKLAIDVLGGYVPKAYSITSMGVFTAKASYAPWQWQQAATRWRVQPLAFGALVSHTVSKGLSTTWDSRYRPNYYWWSARTRVGGFAGSSVGYVFHPSRRGYARSIAAYYELGTNDLYVATYWKNWDALPVSSLLTLGFGLRVQLW